MTEIVCLGENPVAVPPICLVDCTYTYISLVRGLSVLTVNYISLPLSVIAENSIELVATIEVGDKLN